MELPEKTAMKKLKIDNGMLFLFIYVLIILVLAFLWSPGFERLKEFWYLLIFLCGIGIGSFALLKKGDFFRTNFLIAYFGAIVCLLLMNFYTILTGNYDALLVKLIIITVLIYYFSYPFFKNGDQKELGSN